MDVNSDKLNKQELEFLSDLFLKNKFKKDNTIKTLDDEIQKAMRLNKHNVHAISSLQKLKIWNDKNRRDYNKSIN